MRIKKFVKALLLLLIIFPFNSLNAFALDSKSNSINDPHNSANRSSIANTTNTHSSTNTHTSNYENNSNIGINRDLNTLGKNITNTDVIIPTSSDNDPKQNKIQKNNTKAIKQKVKSFSANNCASTDYKFDGKGTDANPYIIKNAADLTCMSWKINNENSNYYGKSWSIINDIDLKGSENNKWTPIGTGNSVPFSGSIYGNGHEISNIYVDKGGYAGFIGVASTIGTISDIGFTGSVNGGSGAYAGGIIADVFTNLKGNATKMAIGTLKNVYNKINVTNSGWDTGGFAGYVTSNGRYAIGLIENCYNAGDVVSMNNAGFVGGFFGGVDGWNNDTTEFKASSIKLIKNSYNIGNIKAVVGGAAGGIDGYSFATGYTWERAENLYNFGNISGVRNGVGGLSGAIIKSKSLKNVANLSQYIQSAGNFGRIVGGKTIIENYNNIFGFINTSKSSSSYFPFSANSPNGSEDNSIYNGENASSSDFVSTNFWKNTLNFSSDIWNFRDDYLPTLKGVGGQTEMRIDTQRVYFDTQGGSYVPTQYVDIGNKAYEPNAPKKDNNIFLGWYNNKDGGVKFDFSKTISDSTTYLYAHWQQTEFSSLPFQKTSNNLINNEKINNDSKNTALTPKVPKVAKRNCLKPKNTLTTEPYLTFNQSKPNLFNSIAFGLFSALGVGYVGSGTLKKIKK